MEILLAGFVMICFVLVAQLKEHDQQAQIS